MKILHTSDWHLGQQLCQRKRDVEHQAFLNWLLEVLQQEQIDLLLLAGDVFDSGMPANYAMEMYYSFLAKCLQTNCRQIVIVGGNHDSPATLRAPEQLLKALQVYVVGSVDSDDPSRDIIVARDANAHPHAIICAVPYLRDRDVHSPKPAEPSEDYDEGIVEGTSRYYSQAASAAVRKRNDLNQPNLPIIATGHLFAQGMQASGTERKLYVGNLGTFPLNRFPEEFD